jgi:hypothetical protein
MGPQVVDNCRGVDRWLEDQFDEAAAVLETRVGVAA